MSPKGGCDRETNRPLRVAFDRRNKLQYQVARTTNDGAWKVRVSARYPPAAIGFCRSGSANYWRGPSPAEEEAASLLCQLQLPGAELGQAVPGAGQGRSHQAPGSCRTGGTCLPARRGGGAASAVRRDPAPDRALARTAHGSGLTGADHGGASVEGRTMRRKSGRARRKPLGNL